MDDARTNGAYAEFPNREAAAVAVEALERRGVPPTRILYNAGSPDQSPAPIDTQERDRQTIASLWQLGWKGIAAGVVVGAVVGAVIAGIFWEFGSAIWAVFTVGMAAGFGGLGLLWSLGLVKGESTDKGTVYDEPDATAPVRLTVRADDPAEVGSLMGVLADAGGRHLARLPESADEPER